MTERETGFEAFQERDTFRRAEKKARKEYEKALRAQAYEQLAPDPSSVQGFYDEEARTQKLEDSPLVPGFEKLVAPQTKDDFVSAFESAAIQHRGQIPDEFWMQFTPDEIKEFGSGVLVDDAGADISDSVAGRLERAQAIQAETAKKQALERKLFNDVVKKRDAQQAPWKGFGGLAGWAWSAVDHITKDKRSDDEIREAIHKEVWGAADELHEDEIASYMSEIRKLYTNLRDGYSARQGSSKIATGTAGSLFADEQQRFMDSDRNRKFAESEKAFFDALEVDSIEGATDEQLESWISQREEVLRQQVKDAPDNIREILTPGFGTGPMEQFGALMGGAMNAGAWFVDQVPEPIMHLTGLTLLTSLIGDSEEAAQENIRQMRLHEGRSDAEKLAEYVNDDVNQAWERMESESPQLWQEYVEMAGGDQLTAMGFFGADLTEQISPEDQTAYLDAVEEQESAIIEQLADQDFTMGDDVLHVLGVWGRNVPGRLSTYFTLLVDDRDFFDQAMQGQWLEMFSDLESSSEAAGHTPSKAMGIDGSMAGLMLDLGGGIIFDPTTWIFGPSGAGRAGAAQSAKAASRLARGSFGKQMVQDFMKFARSPSKGAREMYNLMNWLDPVSRGEILHHLGWRPSTLPKGKWRGVRGAQEIERKLIDDLIEVADVGDFDFKEINKLGDDIVANGFQEPLEITISRGDRSAHISDGVKRGLAAGGKDLDQVPVVIKVVDDVAPGKIVVPGYADDLVEDMVRVQKAPAKRTSNTNLDAGSQQFQYNVVQERIRPDVDIGLGTAELDGQTFRVFKHEGGPTTRPGVKPDEIWYAVDEAGELAAFYDSSHLIQKPGLSGLLHQVLNVSEDAGASFLPRLTERFLSPTSSFSDDGVRFIQNAVNSRLSKALPQSARKGKIVDDLLEEGEELGKILDEAGAGKVTSTRPDSVLPHRLLYGDINPDAITDVIERAILRGATPNSGQNAAIAAHAGSSLRKLLQANAPGRWLLRYTGQNTNTTWRSLSSIHKADDLIDDLTRMFASDADGLSRHMDRILEWEMKQSQRNRATVEKIAALQPRIQRQKSITDRMAALFDDPLEMHADKLSKADKIKYDELRALAAEQDQIIREALAKIDKESGTLGANSEFEKIVTEAFEDYNRNHIATNPAWKDLVDPETGMVPWDQLGKGKLSKKDVVAEPQQVLSDDMLAAAEEAGIDAEHLMGQLSHAQNDILSMETPISPLNAIMASELGGAAYTRATHWGAVSSVRQGALAFHRLWTIDKVFTVSTAATVSFDELLRIFHRFGMKSVFKWMDYRATSLEARAQALLHGKGVARRKGAQYLSPKKQERLRRLQEYGTDLRRLERNQYEQTGLGWTDIAPKDPAYDDAARQFSGGLLQDSGFRAFLEGPESFTEWFLGPDGERLRRGTVVETRKGSPRSILVEDANEYYRGWKTLFEDVILKDAKKAGKHDEVLRHWRETAQKITEGGGKARELPDVAINFLGPIRGVKRELPNKLGPQRLQEAFFDRLFMDPVNFRRGMLAELTRSHEKARLLNLIHDQGIKIVSDPEIETILGLRGLGGASRTNLREVIHEMGLKAGYMPESYLDNLVERAVTKEINHTLYQFDAGSRLGAQARAVFPFGKPWADMAAFWGKEVMRKPVLRGFVNEKNLFYLRSLSEKGLLGFPVPNKSSALLSRLAHTDFEIDKGLIGGEGEGFLHEGGLIPGSESSDFSPLFFLPTSGENPFSYMIPGLGILPIWAIDRVMESMYDPVEEPVEYQNLQDSLAQFLPTVAFQQGGTLSRLAGGGSAAKFGGMAVDIAGMTGHNSFFNLTSQMGDISREIDRTREISALLADPEELEMLLSAESAEEAEALLEALAIEADKRASQSHLAESASRYLAPVKNEFSSSLAEITDVWLQAGALPALEGSYRGNPDNMTDEQRRQAANDVRTNFFALEGWQRDALVVQYPQLAVNMVGSWEWTPDAIDQNLNGTQYAYRTGGGMEDLARHEALVKGGWIRPVQPIVRARRILGVVDAAKRSAAKELYTTQVDRVNDFLWNEVVATDADTQAMLNAMLDTEFAERYDIRDTKELWQNWRTVEEDLEIFLAGELGIEPERGVSTRKDDLTEFDLLRRAVTISDSVKPWGTTFPGWDEGEVPSKYNDFIISSFDPKSQELLTALGLSLEEGSTGQDLYNALQQEAVQRDNYIFDVVRPDYDRYIQDRSNRTGENKMYEAAQSELVAPDVQDRIKEFMFIDTLMQDRRNEDRRNGLSLADQVEMREKFLYIVNGAKDQRTDWNGIWEEQYERYYGALDWEPPEPPTPLDENGKITGMTMLPVVHDVVDGDTLLIQNSRTGPNVLNSVRLLGIRADELHGPNSEAGFQQQRELKAALLQATRDGDRIYLVRDPRFGNTDRYGRMLAWLWIGDEPWYVPDDLRPHQDPSGGDE